MRGFILVLFLFLALSYSEVVKSPLQDYHRRIGIPRANRIRLEEEAIRTAVKNGERIVGGSLADISSIPYQVGLIMQIWVIYQSSCGGVLISSNRVITAAHCNDDGNIKADRFTIVFGSSLIFSGGTRIDTTDVVPHPNWNYNTLENDIALLRFPWVSLSSTIQPISLPSGNEVNQNFAGFIGVASGWGFTSDNGIIPWNQALSSVELPVITNAQCTSFFGFWARSSNICTSGEGRRGICHGDSGGPLTVFSNGRRILVGIASFGSWYGCEASDPNAFARITSFLSWILSV